MIKRTVRQFSTLMWRANSPAEYELVGYPAIKGIFNGTAWQLNDKADVQFRDMQQLSEVVEIVCENYNKRGPF